MGKIVVDSDIIDKDLIPLSNTNFNNINNAYNIAGAISTSEFNWASIKSRLEDCANTSRKYKEWIISINNTYKTCFTSNTEEIENINITEVKRSMFTVK